MKKSNAAKALARKKAMAEERGEGKLKGAADKRHERAESRGYERMEAGAEKGEHKK